MLCCIVDDLTLSPKLYMTPWMWRFPCAYDWTSTKISKLNASEMGPALQLNAHLLSVNSQLRMSLSQLLTPCYSKVAIKFILTMKIPNRTFFSPKGMCRQMIALFYILNSYPTKLIRFYCEQSILSHHLTSLLLILIFFFLRQKLRELDIQRKDKSSSDYFLEVRRTFSVLLW